METPSSRVHRRVVLQAIQEAAPGQRSVNRGYGQRSEKETRGEEIEETAGRYETRQNGRNNPIGKL